MTRSTQQSRPARRVLRALVAWFGLSVMPAIAHAQDWQVGSMPSVSSGRYGADTRTDVFYTPITARRLFDKGDVTLVFPMLCVRGTGGLVVVNGSPVVPDVRTRTGVRGTPSTGTGTTSPATRGETTPVRTAGGTATVAPVVTTGPATTACGFGDVVIRGRYFVVDGRGPVPTVAVRGHVKAPTASTERGLGTGSPDEGVGVEISQPVGAGAVLLADAGYTVIGRPAGAEYQNTWWYDVGVGRDLAGGALNVSVFFEEYGAVIPGTVTSRDILAAATVKVAGGWRVHTAAMIGVSDGAPGYGATLGFSRRF